MRRRIAILGAGGLAREVAWLIEDINRVQPSYDVAGFIVSDLSRLSDTDQRDRVLGDYEWLARNRVDALAVAIGLPQSRAKVASALKAQFPDVQWPSLIHPSAQFDRASCQVSEGVIICAGVIGTVNVVFEPFSFVNLSCTIGHESRIGSFTVLNPTVNVSGGVVLEEGVLVGTGAQLFQYIRVGAGARIGAGAVVTKSVDAQQTVVGIPAKPLIRPIEA